MANALPTTFTPTSQSALNTDIEQLHNAIAGSYTIDLTGNIAEGQAGQPAGIFAIDLPPGVTLTIDGGGHTLEGLGQNGGLAVISGKVTIANLTIEDTVAQGGSGEQSGGGGAGLGGGLFVGAVTGSTATVSLDDVSFVSDSAKGGAGGAGGGGGAGGHSSLIVAPTGAAGVAGGVGTNGTNGTKASPTGTTGSPGSPAHTAAHDGGFGRAGGRGGAGGAGGAGFPAATGGDGGGGGSGAAGGRGGTGGTGGAGGTGGKGGNAGTSTHAAGARGGHGGPGGAGGGGGFGGGGGAGGAAGAAGAGGKTSFANKQGGTGGTGGAGGDGGHGGFGGAGGGGSSGAQGGAGGAGAVAGAGGSGGGGGVGGEGGFGGGGGGGGRGGAVGAGSSKFIDGLAPHSGVGGPGASGGFGAGHGAGGAQGGAGGGGLGAGGDIFLGAGATLLVDGGLLNGGSVAGGASASQGGQADGSGIFLQAGETITLGAAAAQTLAIHDNIADQGGAGALVIAATGTVQLSGDDSYGGGTRLQSGTLELGSAHAAGTGPIVFDPGHDPTLQFTAATAPSGNPIDDFIAGDTIEIKNYVATSHSYSNGTLTLEGNGGPVHLNIVGRTAAQFQVSTGGTNSTFITTDAPPCYCAGTRLAAEAGEVAVESLAVGDRVRSRDGSLRPIVWIGRRRIDCRRHGDPRLVWPVRIAAGAVGEGVPRRDLLLSPDHAVLMDDVLIPVKLLINDATIAQEPQDDVTYYHVELARHDILLAEGLAAESYLDTGNRHRFANGGPAVSLYPEFATPNLWPPDAAAPLATDETRVRPVWQRLAARARALGRPVPEPTFTLDPALRLEIGGRILGPMHVLENRYMFCLPPHRGAARLLSRAGRPTDRTPWADDSRRLGVYVGRIVAHDHDGPTDLPIDHPSLADGWWAVERAGPLVRRWTDGGAALTISPAASLLEIHLAGTIAYRTDRVNAAEQERRLVA